MDRINLPAKERQVLGKKVKTLRRDGQLPGHVYGKGLETEHVTVTTKEFLKIYKEAGETALVNLKIGEEKIKPVLIRGVQYDVVTDLPLHVDFYQVNLKEKVKVPVPLVLIGEEPESVRLGEAIVLQTLNEIEIEALPTDLIEKIEIDISKLQNIDDAITLGQLNYDREKLTIEADPEETVVKLAPAVSAEMEKLLEEQEAEQAATEATEGEAEGEVKEGEEAPGGEAAGEAGTREEGEEKKPEDSSKSSQ